MTAQGEIVLRLLAAMAGFALWIPGYPWTAACVLALAAVGGAVIVADGQCSGERLAREIEGLRTPPGRLAEMRAAAASLGRPDAVAAVVAVVEGHARARWQPERSPGPAAGARPGSL